MNRDELYQIGIDFRAGKYPNTTWEELNEKYDKPFKTGEAWRCFVKNRIKIDNTNKTTSEDKQTHKDFNDKDFDYDPKNTYKNTIEMNKDGSQSSDKLLEMSEEQAKDVNYLLKAHGYDIKAWELVSARNNIWNVYSKQDGVQTLYSSKIVVKPRTEYVWNPEDIEKLFSNLKTNYENKIDVIPQQYQSNGNVLFVPIADFHYGLYSDKLTTGNDYNIELAEKYYYYVLNDIINRNQNKRFEKVVFVIGNDFINSDNLNNTTTKGTPQDSSPSWFVIVENAIELIKNGIDMLTAIAPVEVLYVTSNHDLHTMFGIMHTINAWYRNDINVSIDTSPLPRKYYKIGKTEVGLSHDIKVKDALKLFTTEAKNDWSECTHMIWMLAHLHQSMIYDKQGYLEILRLPTISGWSRWTNNSGYVQSDKKNQSFIINKEMGIIDTINTVILD